MTKRILVTGATGKVGRTVLRHAQAVATTDALVIRALCHQRGLPTAANPEVVRGVCSAAGAPEMTARQATAPRTSVRKRPSRRNEGRFMGLERGCARRRA